MLAGEGELDGIRVLSAATVREALMPQVGGSDWFGFQSTFGLGLSIDVDSGVAGCLGGGGSQLWVDPRLHMGFGYVQNTGHPADDRGRVGKVLCDACRTALAT